MICNDRQIVTLCKSGMVKPFNIEMVQSASLDIRIGTTCKIRKLEWENHSICQSTKDNPFLVQPGERILIESLENFFLPDNIAAQFILKSSIARNFFQHMFSGWCDPGWCGKLTMEFINHDLDPYPIWVGKPIGQLIFHQLHFVERPYNGRYQNIFNVEKSRD